MAMKELGKACRRVGETANGRNVEMPTRRCGVVARPGGEPLWHVNRRPRDICLDACMTGNLLKQAAPGNVSTRVRFVARRPDEHAPNGTMDKTLRAVISGSRLFNTVFGLPRSGENITRSLATFQSGSPPGLHSCQRFAPQIAPRTQVLVSSCHSHKKS